MATVGQVVADTDGGDKLRPSVNNSDGGEVDGSVRILAHHRFDSVQVRFTLILGIFISVRSSDQF
ncbi:hypothetical protein Hanom_Chr04g00334411 [Helianthus anomalus]